MKDYIKCIASTSLSGTGYSLCGKPITMDFVFGSIDDAFHNLKAQGRLLPCKKCVQKILEQFYPIRDKRINYERV